MRRMVAAFVIFAVITAGVITERVLVDDICKSLEGKLDALSEPYDTKAIEDISKEWNKKEKVLEVLTPHEHTDEIKVDMARLKMLARENEQSDAGMLIGELKSHIDIIRESCKISLTNIF